MYDTCLIVSYTQRCRPLRYRHLRSHRSLDSCKDPQFDPAACMLRCSVHVTVLNGNSMTAFRGSVCSWHVCMNIVLSCARDSCLCREWWCVAHSQDAKLWADGQTEASRERELAPHSSTWSSYQVPGIRWDGKERREEIHPRSVAAVYHVQDMFVL